MSTMTIIEKIQTITQTIHHLALNQRWEDISKQEEERKKQITLLKGAELNIQEKERAKETLDNICVLNKEIMTLSKEHYEQQKSSIINLKKSAKVKQQYQNL